MKPAFFLMMCAILCTSCQHTSEAQKRRAEKHVQDSIALSDQQRSLSYYQSQLELLLPKADSILPLFKYEKNEKYQDHGYYVRVYKGTTRVLVRDDGKEPILVYRDGKRLDNPDLQQYPEALHLAVVMADIKELEKRIYRTSLEIEKYQKRLQNQKNRSASSLSH